MGIFDNVAEGSRKAVYEQKYIISFLLTAAVYHAVLKEEGERFTFTELLHITSAAFIVRRVAP